MGLKSDDDVTVDDGDGGGKWVSCSICLEVVKDNGDRSWAKLHCGHQFHLDCIGSAFNVKGAMQCPNCRKIEKGQWLYANNCRPLPDFSMDDWTHDEDLYELGYSEMFGGSSFDIQDVGHRTVQLPKPYMQLRFHSKSFGVHWCPFGQLARFPSAFEEGDFSSSAYHDILGHHTIFSEHAAVSSSTHPCPYIAYFGPIHPSSSNSSGNVVDGSSFSTPWNGPSIPREVPNSYTFPAMDIHYHTWEHHAPAFSTSSSRVGGGDQPTIASTTQRSVRSNSDIHRPGSFMHPFLVNHSSGARAGSSVASTLIPPYPGSNARTRDRVQALQAYYQQQQQQQQQQPPPSHSLPVRAPMVSGSRRSGNHRGVAQVGSGASSSDQTSGFYFFPAGSSGHNFQDPETPLSTRFHSWERDHLPSFLLSQVDRESSWEAFQPPAAGSEPGIRPISFRQRHGFERSSSHNRS